MRTAPFGTRSSVSGRRRRSMRVSTSARSTRTSFSTPPQVGPTSSPVQAAPLTGASASTSTARSSGSPTWLRPQTSSLPSPTHSSPQGRPLLQASGSPADRLFPDPRAPGALRHRIDNDGPRKRLTTAEDLHHDLVRRLQDGQSSAGPSRRRLRRDRHRPRPRGGGYGPRDHRWIEGGSDDRLSRRPGPGGAEPPATARGFGSRTPVPARLDSATPVPGLALAGKAGVELAEVLRGHQQGLGERLHLDGSGVIG